MFSQTFADHRGEDRSFIWNRWIVSNEQFTCMTCIIIIKLLNQFSFVTVASDVKCEVVSVWPWPKIKIMAKKTTKKNIQSDSNGPELAGEVLFMLAAPRLPVRMFTAVKPLLGGAIGSAVFQGSDYKLHTSSVFCWSFARLEPVAAEALPCCVTLHSNVSAHGNSASWSGALRYTSAARGALLSHLLGLHSRGTHS